MKSIITLVRIKKREMDALKRQQAVLERQRDDVVGGIARLATQLEQEMKLAEEMPEMGHFFGDFSLAIKKRQEVMRLHVRRLEAELDKLADQLRERFSELKKYEITLANWERKRDMALAHRAQQEMDEIGIRGYVRRHEA